MLRKIKLLLLDFFSPLLRFYLIKCIGISCGKSKFVGIPLIVRHKYSQISIGDNCRIVSSKLYNLIGVNKCTTIATLSGGAVIKIGNNVGMSGGAITAFKSVQIGDNGKIGANVHITDSDWHLEDPRSNGSKEVKIGNNVWLGLNVVVLKGVEIGDNVIVGAGSVVTKDIPANTIAAGNPCRVIKKIRS